MKKLLFTLLILFLSPLSLWATESIPLSQLYAQTNELDQIEEQRRKSFEEQLGFSLPQYTDNPSYTITFTDSSTNKNGVQIEIDGKEFVNITSPYVFPALAIGQHIVKFRFNDSGGNIQTLEYTFIVIPRSPIINPPVIESSSVSIKGTGLSNSEILLFLTSNTFNHTEILKTDSNGEWNTIFKPENDLSEGIYTITAYARKNGYASEFSEAILFEVGNNVNNNEEKDKKNISFAFKDIEINNIINTVTLNPDLIILIVVAILLGAIPTALLKGAYKKDKEEKIFKTAEKSIKGEKKEEKTLRELFESEGEEKKVDEIKEDSKKSEIRVNTDVSMKIKEEKPQEKIVNKEDFLKDYKSADPDELSGKEKSSEKVKKEIKVSLTSREE